MLLDPEKVNVSEWATGQPADAVECCALAPLQQWLAVATYKVLGTAADGATLRTGGVTLLHVDEATGALEPRHCVPGDAVLDVKWAPADAGVLAVADAAGRLGLIRLTEDGSSVASLGSLVALDAPADSASKPPPLALAVDWNHMGGGSSRRLAASFSSGEVAVIAADSPGESAVVSMHRAVDPWTAHTLEAWTVAFDRHDAAVVYTGGDDCMFAAWDLRDGGPPAIRVRNGGRRAGEHSAGVTACQSHPDRPHIVATGSYDESVRVWDLRQPREPISRLEIGGGAWRIKWRGDQMLVAGMHSGLHVARFGASLELVATHPQGQGAGGLAYGADWFSGRVKGVSSEHVATCSFYDERLLLWGLS